MSQNTADIVGSVGSRFTITLDSATVVRAKLAVESQVYPVILRGERDIEVVSLPAGDSVLNLDLAWAPGDLDATIDVGTVTRSVMVASPRPKITAGETPAFIRLYGTDSTGPR